MKLETFNLEHLILMSFVDLEATNEQIQTVRLKLDPALTSCSFDLCGEGLRACISDISVKLRTVVQNNKDRVVIRLRQKEASSVLDKLQIFTEGTWYAYH